MTEESPLDRPSARNLPLSAPVSKLNSFAPAAEKTGNGWLFVFI
jgi:hypothetical protein